MWQEGEGHEAVRKGGRYKTQRETLYTLEEAARNRVAWVQPTIHNTPLTTGLRDGSVMEVFVGKAEDPYLNPQHLHKSLYSKN